MQITEQWILDQAPGPAVAENGRALSEADCFSARRRTEDAKIYWAECAGSAKNPYYVSIDWSLSEDEPVYSCSCPSRHLPCRHALGLAFELLADKPFDIDRPPPYVIRMRLRHAAEKARAEARLERARKYDAAARGKKLERQLEGLAKAEKLSDSLLRGGLTTLPELPSQTLERMARELGGYGLTGARDIFERIALLDRRSRQDEYSIERCHAEILRLLSRLRVMIRRSRDYLRELLSSGSYAMEDPLLFELLGGTWDPDELREIGSCRKHARLMQLSYDVFRSETGGEDVELGYWLELSRGDIVHTQTSPSPKDLRCLGAADSCFDLLEIPLLYERPGTPCPRVWWDEPVRQELTEEAFTAALRCAGSRLSGAVAAAKAQLAEPLLPLRVPTLTLVGAIGFADGIPVLSDQAGDRVPLRDRTRDGAGAGTVRRLLSLPNPPAEGDALFGVMFFDESDRRFCLQPHSVLTAQGLTRLKF